MYKELVKQLRSTVSRSKRTLFDDAADAIEQLQKELREERFTLKNAVVLGCYMGNGTWFLEDYPEIDDATVLCWAPTLYWEGK